MTTNEKARIGGAGFIKHYCFGEVSPHQYSAQTHRLHILSRALRHALAEAQNKAAIRQKSGRIRQKYGKNPPFSPLEGLKRAKTCTFAGVQKSRFQKNGETPSCLTRAAHLCRIEAARATSRVRVWQPAKPKAGARHRRMIQSGGFFVPAVSNAAACAWEPERVAGLPWVPVCHPRASRLQSSVWQRTAGGCDETSNPRKQTMQTPDLSGASAHLSRGAPRLSIQKSNGLWHARICATDGHVVTLTYEQFVDLSHAIRLWWAIHSPPDPSPSDNGLPRIRQGGQAYER